MPGTNAADRLPGANSDVWLCVAHGGEVMRGTGSGGAV